MGKASKWFRGLFGLKRPDSDTSSSPSKPSTTESLSKPPTKKKWCFVKSYREKDHHQNFQNKPIQRSRTGIVQSVDNDDPSNHAIAVAEATKAVAEAAVAAAEAAAAVVRLTSSGRAITTNATTTTTATMTMSMSTPSFGNGAAVALNSPSAYLSGRCAGYEDREEWAAVKIQSHFRAYLSRRALRALKALVRLQALIRGHIVRKHTADILRRIHTLALARAQARTRTVRAQIFESPFKSNQFNYPGPATPEKHEHMIRARSMKHGENLMFRRNGSKSNGKVNSNQDKARRGSNWIDSEMDVRSWEREGSSLKTSSREDERNDKILEVDNGKPHTLPKRRNLFHSCHLSLGSDQCSHSFTTSKESTAHQTALSPSSCEVQSLSPMKFSQDVDEEPYCTADNSPQFYSASSKGGASNRGPFTPTKSDCSRSCLSGYSDYPNYMSYTASSKAKMRSLSAPKQRPQYERSSSTKRYSIHGYGDSRMTQKVSSLHANFTNKAYPGSGRLDRLGMPVREELISFSGGHWHRY